MPCYTQDELVEIAIAAVISGGIGIPAIDHTRSCSACGRELEAYMKILQSLKFDLANDGIPSAGRPCLSDEEVAAFVDGKLGPDKREVLSRHLAECPNCLKQVADLTLVLRDVDIGRASVLEYVVGIAKVGLSLVRWPREGAQVLQLDPVPLLGPADHTTDIARKILSWTQTISEFLLEFTVWSGEEGLMDLTLRVSKYDLPLQTGRVNLLSEGSMLQSEELQSGGSVNLRRLEPKHYDIEVHLQPVTVIRCSITFFPLND